MCQFGSRSLAVKTLPTCLLSTEQLNSSTPIEMQLHPRLDWHHGKSGAVFTNGNKIKTVATFNSFFIVNSSRQVEPCLQLVGSGKVKYFVDRDRTLISLANLEENIYCNNSFTTLISQQLKLVFSSAAAQHL